MTSPQGRRGAPIAHDDRSAGPVTFTTELVEERERFDFWREIICRPFVELNARPLGEVERFYASVSGSVAGPAMLSQTSAAPNVSTRTPAGIARADEHYFMVSLVLDGTGVLVQDERTAMLGPGDFALFDTARPYTMQFECEYSMYTLMVPQPVFRTVLPRASDATAITVNGRESAALVRPLLDNLLNTAGTASPASQRHLTTAALELVAASLAEITSLSAQGSLGAAHLARAQDHIERHLSDPGLSPEAIARAVFISERHLHALFRDTGAAVARYVMDRRLDRAYSDLTDPRLTHVPVADIATRLGFKSPAHFSKVFKARYGVGPREHRNTAGRLRTAA